MSREKFVSKKMGRPRKFPTEEAVEKVCWYVLVEGMSYRAAATLFGVHYSTVYRAIDRYDQELRAAIYIRR